MESSLSTGGYAYATTLALRRSSARGSATFEFLRVGPVADSELELEELLLELEELLLELDVLRGSAGLGAAAGAGFLARLLSFFGFDFLVFFFGDWFWLARLGRASLETGARDELLDSEVVELEVLEDMFVAAG